MISHNKNEMDLFSRIVAYEVTWRGCLHVRFDFYAAGLDLPWKEKLFKFLGIFFSNKALLFYACHFHTFNKQARSFKDRYHKRMESASIHQKRSNCVKRGLNTYRGTCKESS